MYPKPGDLVACRDHFKLIVVDEKYPLYHCVVLMDTQGDLKPGDGWILSKANWELGRDKGMWRIENGN